MLDFINDFNDKSKKINGKERKLMKYRHKIFSSFNNPNQLYITVIDDERYVGSESLYYNSHEGVVKRFNKDGW